jgi:hypothetical protein
MATILPIIVDFLTNAGVYVAAVNAVLLALIALCLMIPGEQPEKALQSAVDFLSKFSKK